MPARRDFPVDEGFAGGRLETFLRRKLGLPRTLALKALRKGWVRLSGHRAKADARLEPGSVVTVTNPALALPGLEGPRRERPRVSAELVARARASIRHRDEDLVVSAKPAGEVVHAGTGHAAGWIDALREALGSPEECVPIGRLDRDTSGLLLVALQRAASRKLFEFLRENRVSRTYLALVSGRVESARGEIDAPLEKVEEEDGKEQMHVTLSGKPALTRFEVVRRFKGATLVRVRIDTGRTHQIRAHLASIGHPILLDPRYGPWSRPLASFLDISRLFLHAGELDFPHPRDGSPRHFEEPLPTELRTALERLS